MGETFLRAETRSVLARYRVELAQLRVGAFGTVVRLQGTLQRASGLPELTHEALEALEREIRRIPGVRRVEMHLVNWCRQESGWKAIENPVPEPAESVVLQAEPEPIVCT